MYSFRPLDPQPPTATPILGQSPKKNELFVSGKSLGPQSIIKWPDMNSPLMYTFAVEGRAFLCSSYRQKIVSERLKHEMK